MTVIDSDIIIYSAFPQSKEIRAFILSNNTFVSAVSRVEVFGFQLPVSDEVIDKAVELRQQRKINLGDSLIAATALVNNFALLTNNKERF